MVNLVLFLSWLRFLRSGLPLRELLPAPAQAALRRSGLSLPARLPGFSRITRRRSGQVSPTSP